MRTVCDTWHWPTSTSSRSDASTPSKSPRLAKTRPSGPISSSGSARADIPAGQRTLKRIPGSPRSQMHPLAPSRTPSIATPPAPGNVCVGRFTVWPQLPTIARVPASVKTDRRFVVGLGWLRSGNEVHAVSRVLRRPIDVSIDRIVGASDILEVGVRPDSLRSGGRPDWTAAIAPGPCLSHNARPSIWRIRSSRPKASGSRTAANAG